MLTTLRSLLQSSLQGKIGPVLENLIEQMLTKCEQSPEKIPDVIEKLRITIELFCDAKIAAQLYPRMRRAAGLDDAAPRAPQ